MRELGELAREGPDDAAQLDRPVRGRARAVRAVRARTSSRRPRTTIEVFTTRIDTIYGANFIVLAPEHPLVQQFADASARSGGVPRQGGEVHRRRIGPARMTGEVEKEGFDTGRTAINPFTGKPVPIWVANFVLDRLRHRRGDGRAGPRRARLRVRAEVQPAGHGRRRSRPASRSTPTTMTEAHAGEGALVNSGDYNGLPWEEANRRMTADAETRGIGEGTVQYRLKDWGISRQRYWGTPIPVVYCEKDGMVPVPDDSLPVVLPKTAEFSGRGDSPLGARCRSSSTRRARRAAGRRGARPTRWTRSSTRRGTSSASAIRRTTSCRSIPTRSATGARSISTSAASSTPSCT